MIDDNFHKSSENFEDEDELPDEISKSQRKRDAHAIRDLGAYLSELGTSELATIPLPDDVLASIESLQSIKANGARKRQLGYLAKQLRQIDLVAVEQAIEKIKQTARAHTKNHHIVEQWRDRLLGEYKEESSKDALTSLLSQYPNADRQLLRQLQRQALQDRESGKSKAASRQLFKLVRELVVAGVEYDE